MKKEVQSFDVTELLNKVDDLPHDLQERIKLFTSQLDERQKLLELSQ